MTRSALAIAIAIATVLAGSAALAQEPSTRPGGVTGTTSGDSRADNPNRDNTNRTTDRNTTGAQTGNNAGNRNTMDSTNRPDEKFLKDFAQANAAEVETGKIAQEKAQNAEVKAFAKHMVDDHSKTIGKVESIASKANVDVKAKPDLIQKAKATLLENRDGANFDAAYMKAMVNDHEKVVEMLQKEIREGQDPSVKQLASQALPDVQKHLKMAQDLHAKVSGGTRTSGSSGATSNTGSAEKSATDR
jgi:putative membrane protein